jgi:hypothetical protein
MSQTCTDKVVGGILAGWRYDISGLAPEMRGDYEAHLAECQHCRSRQRLHRTIDISLIVIATVSAMLFLVAFVAVRHFSPRHALILEIIALGGFAFSILMWVVVAIATPAPLVMVDAAKTGARALHDRLPEKVRDRVPEGLKQRIS